MTDVGPDPKAANDPTDRDITRRGRGEGGGDCLRSIPASAPPLDRRMCNVRAPRSNNRGLSRKPLLVRHRRLPRPKPKPIECLTNLQKLSTTSGFLHEGPLSVQSDCGPGRSATRLRTGRVAKSSLRKRESDSPLPTMQCLFGTGLRSNGPRRRNTHFSVMPSSLRHWRASTDDRP